MATGIIAIEVIYTILLLILIHLNGDTDVVVNGDNPPFTNVRQRDPIYVALQTVYIYVTCHCVIYSLSLYVLYQSGIIFTQDGIKHIRSYHSNK